MNWVKFRAAFARFITWRMRLNRMQFGVGFAALCGGGALFIQLIMFGLASLVGGIEVVFNNPQWTFPLFALFIPLVWALLAGRAHDLGWPGWPFVALYMSPFPTLLIQMDERFGISGGRLRAFAELMPLDVQRAIYFIPIVLFWIAFFTLAATPGQKKPNRYGEQRSPGL